MSEKVGTQSIESVYGHYINRNRTAPNLTATEPKRNRNWTETQPQLNRNATAMLGYFWAVLYIINWQPFLHMVYYVYIYI